MFAKSPVRMVVPQSFSSRSCDVLSTPARESCRLSKDGKKCPTEDCERYSHRVRPASRWRPERLLMGRGGALMRVLRRTRQPREFLVRHSQILSVQWLENC